MTHIHEIGALPDPPDPQVRKGSFRYVIYGITVAIAALNAVAAMNLYKVTAEVRDIDQRLSELSAFEKRLMQKIDGMNNGVQSQFDRVNNQIQASMRGSVESGARQVESLGVEADVPSWNKLTTDNIQSQYSSFVTRIEDSDEKAEMDIAELAESESSYDSVTYERIVNPDGKTLYKKKY